MTEQTSEPTSLVGPVRYDLSVQVPADGDDVDEAVFTVNALALPRVGDELTFEGGGTFLAVKVTHVNHWFFAAEDKPPRRTITVVAESLPKFEDLPVRADKTRNPPATQQDRKRICR